MPRGICEMKEKPAELRSVDERSFLQRRGQSRDDGGECL